MWCDRIHQQFGHKREDSEEVLKTRPASMGAKAKKRAFSEDTTMGTLVAATGKGEGSQTSSSVIGSCDFVWVIFT